MELFDTKLLHANDLFNGVYAVLYFFTEGLCHALTAFTARFRLAEQKEEYVIAVGVNFGGLYFVFACGEIFICKQALLISRELSLTSSVLPSLTFTAMNVSGWAFCAVFSAYTSS